MKLKTNLIAGLLLLAAWSHAMDYYLAPDGDDNNRGTRNQPFRTIDKVNALLKPGDSAIFLPGSYAGCIEPARSGEADKVITYRAEKPGTVRLTGGRSGQFGEMLLIALRERSRIAVDGFTAENTGTCRWFKLDKAAYCTISNCRFDGVTAAHPIRCANSSFNRFENIYAGRCLYTRPNGLLADDMWNNFNCSSNLFSGLYITKAGHRPFGLWFDCENNVVRDSVFDCRWGRNFEFFSARKVLMERCVITNCYDGSGSADARAKLFTIDSIFRRNLVFRNHGAPLVINAYKYQELPTFGMIDTRMYGNTFFRNVDFGFQMIDIARNPDPHMVRGNILKNNIFSENNPGGDGTALSLGGNIAPDNRFLNNLLRGVRAGQPTVRLTWTENKRLTAAEANRDRAARFRDNFDADPGFADAEKDNFQLKHGSPAIDRGAALAIATAAGRGRELPVDDARYFYDGFGIPGETGDEIVIGRFKIPARVIKADWEKNLLTLDRTISFARGDAVNLPYAGNAPDLGAYESGMDTGPAVPPGLRNLAVEQGKAPLARCDFEPENLEAWFYLWSYTRQKNSTVEIDRNTANTGKQSIRVYATGDDSVMSLLMRPGLWEIDLFPKVRFAYRIPKGVPVGIAVSPFDAAEFQFGEVFLGGSPAAAYGKVKNLAKYQLIDDDAWHTVELDVRTVREAMPKLGALRTIRFYTVGNGKQGDCYWIDDFSIEP